MGVSSSNKVVFQYKFVCLFVIHMSTLNIVDFMYFIDILYLFVEHFYDQTDIWKSIVLQTTIKAQSWKLIISFSKLNKLFGRQNTTQFFISVILDGFVRKRERFNNHQKLNVVDFNMIFCSCSIEEDRLLAENVKNNSFTILIHLKPVVLSARATQFSLLKSTSYKVEVCCV